MLRACQGHMLTDIKLILSVYVFQYTPLGVSGPKNQFLAKPEVSHKKVKVEFFALDIAFKLD